LFGKIEDAQIAAEVAALEERAQASGVL